MCVRPIKQKRCVQETCLKTIILSVILCVAACGAGLMHIVTLKFTPFSTHTNKQNKNILIMIIITIIMGVCKKLIVSYSNSLNLVNTHCHLYSFTFILHGYCTFI